MLSQSTPESFTSFELLHRQPWIFATAREYTEWRLALAKDLGLDAFAILVVGSACTGYILNPKKNFKKFDDRSDIDVAVISPRHFDESWRWLRNLPPAERLKGSF